MTAVRLLCAAGAVAAALAMTAAVATTDAHSAGSPRSAPSPAPPAASTSTPTAIGALPAQTNSAEAACATALAPGMGAAEAGQTVVTPKSCIGLSTADYQVAAMAAEQQYYLQTHPGAQ